MHKSRRRLSSTTQGITHLVDLFIVTKHSEVMYRTSPTALYCDVCGTRFETQAHFLLGCLAWEPLRQPLHHAAKAAGIFGPPHLSQLLSNPKLLKSFVTATGRFE
ncbi:hypothetical protein B0H19DRAFT_1272526 [Mycena capillaripes]|nr:hypothetical protein B0H19DRAFT_1272479 [Mycena capillaripes]KAJ6533127.1 hypothetical protein B0H19DRAFT_1272526 [Mycena capillaripes]